MKACKSQWELLVRAAEKSPRVSDSSRFEATRKSDIYLKEAPFWGVGETKTAPFETHGQKASSCDSRCPRTHGLGGSRAL